MNSIKELEQMKNIIEYYKLYRQCFLYIKYIINNNWNWPIYYRCI